MNDSTSAHADERVPALAALLHALAGSADDGQGRQRWESLTGLVGSQGASGTGDELAGVPELADLQQEPGMDRAEILARVLLARADANEDFGHGLRAWRSQQQIQATERALGAAAPATGTRPAPDRPGEEPNPDAYSTEDKPRWRAYLSGPWPVTIFGGVAAAVIAALIVPHLTGNAPPTASPTGGATPSSTAAPSRAVTPSSVAAPPPGRSIAGTAANSPARVEAVTPLNTAPDESFAVKNKVQLTAQQLARLNSEIRSGKAGAAATAGFPSSIHAVPVSSAFTNVTIIGNEKATVTITGLQVVKNCHAPLQGTLFYNPSQGVNGTIGVGFDLDSAVDYARKNDYGFRGGDFFHDHVVTLKPGETQTFTIDVRTLLHYCQFSFRLTVATPSGAITEDIDDNGKPFELTAKTLPSSLYAAVYVGGIEATLTPGLHDPKGNFVQVNPKTFHD